MRLAFLASNNGSGFRAITAAIEKGRLAATPVLAISNRRTAPALGYAIEHGVPVRVIPTSADPAGADRRLAEALISAMPDLVILSGYLRKLGPATLGAFKGRILNIHPALLPKFGGQGMYGRRVHEAVLAAGETVTGATVHVVDGEYDHGPIVAQCEVPVQVGDTAADIERRVTSVEPALFVSTLQAIAEGRLILPAQA